MGALDFSLRIERRFASLKEEGRGGLVTFVTAGDPDLETAQAILDGLPEAGADVIELGMPFSDPMADGPAIQAAGVRALNAGHTMGKTIEMVCRFREKNTDTPVILMGYYNPIHAYGVDRFLKDVRAAGVDGLIVVDLPPEEDEALCLPSQRNGVHFIRLATPTTDEARLPSVLANTGGFLYYVSVAGVTGGKSAKTDDLTAALEKLRAQTDLPIAVGFGIRTPVQAAGVAKVADAAVVGSALVETVRAHLDNNGRAQPDLVEAVHRYVTDLATGVRGARLDKN